jgi:hypothetical protein
VRRKFNEREIAMGAEQVHPLIKRVIFNWEFSRFYSSDVDEIVYYIRPQEGFKSDRYDKYTVAPKDTLPFLRNIDWWERRIGEKHPDDISGLVNDIGPHVQMYCRGRWARPKAELAESMGLTPSKLRQWVAEMHLETEFGGRQDGYKQWLSAQEALGIADLADTEKYSPKSFSELEFRYVDLDSFESSCNGGKGRLRHSAADLKMVNNKSRKPSEVWVVFIGCLDTNRRKSEPGLLPATVRKQYVSKIREGLRHRFKLEDDPFQKFEPGKGWRLRSRVIKPSDQTGVDTPTSIANTRDARAKEWYSSDLESPEHIAKRKVTREFPDSDKSGHSD